MSLYKRGRIWWVKLTGRGAPALRESTGTADLDAAQEYHDRRAAELWRIRRFGERPRTALADAAADWLENHARHKRSFADDQLRLSALLPWLPAYLDELTTPAMTRIRDRLRAERDALQEDAERYRWLLLNAVHEKPLGDKYVEFHCDFETWNDISAAIDAARKS
jgi:hypothetical protein